MKVKNIIKTIGAVVLVGGILSACTTEVEEVEKSSETPKQETQQEEKVEDKVFKVGDTVKVNGVEITITKASFTEPAEFTPAEKGKVLTIEIATNNVESDSAFIDSTEFNLYDKEGNQLPEYYGYDELAISGDINKGKKLNGKLYFDVPEADSYELVYKPSFTLDNKEIKWTITPSN
jgi:hypothetical protein